MEIFGMDQAEIIRWIITFIVGGAGWAFGLGRNVITNKVMEEVSQRFVMKEIYNLKMENIQASIAALQLEQKTNHADMVTRLDKIVEEIHKKIEKLQE